MNPGIDFLGMAHKLIDVEMFADLLPDGWPVGVFWDEFGPCIPALQRFKKQRKKRHRPNAPAFRIQVEYNKNHDYVSMDKLKYACKELSAYAKTCPKVEFCASPTCEHKETNQALLKEALKTVASYSTLTPVNNPRTGALVTGYINETHDPKRILTGKWMASTDGLEAADMNCQRYFATHKKALITFLWSHRFNLRGAEPAPPIPERTAVPDEDYIRDIIALASPPVTPPKASFKYEPLKYPSLWKIFAEESEDENDKRRNKPLSILPIKGMSASIITKDNQLIGELAYYGTYTGGLFRYYSNYANGCGLSSSAIGRKATKLSGSRYIWLRCGEKIYGPVDPYFKSGNFAEDR